MAIHFTCPACKKSVRASDDCAGMNGPCPSCKEKIPIPRIATLVVNGEDGNGNGHGNGNGRGDVKEPQASAKKPSEKGMTPASKKPSPGDGSGAKTPTEAAKYLKFKCPNCEKMIGFPTTESGQPAPCPKCLVRIMIPEKDGEESFIVGALAPAHKNMPVARTTPSARLHPIRRTASRLGGAVKQMPLWQTGLISVGCLAALVVAGVIIVGEFRKEWEAREQERLASSPQNEKTNALLEVEPTKPVNPSATPPQKKQEPVVPANAASSAKAAPAAPSIQIGNGGEVIGTRDGSESVRPHFDPLKLIDAERKAPSRRAVEGEEPADQTPATDPADPLPIAQPTQATQTETPADPADPVTSLLDEVEKKKPAPTEPKVTPPQTPSKKEPVPEFVGPKAFQPPPDAALIAPPKVCGDCQGTSVLPLPRYTPYVWVYSAATPAAMSAVPFVPCPKCQGKVDSKTLVAQETERMRTAPAETRAWEKKLNARMECGETRYVSMASQLSPATSRHVLQQLDKLTKFLQTHFRSAMLTQTRPNTHQLLITWDRVSYERLIDLMAAENPTHDWELTKKTSGSIGRKRCFFNAHRGLGTPPEHMALFQFAHMLVLEATDGKSPDWLTEGFSSYCENTVLRKNLCYAFRYELNQVRLTPNWNSEIAKYGRKGKLEPWDRIFKLDLIGMKALDYLTCYSMVRFLSSDPVRFNTFLVNIRAGVDSKRAIEHAYGRKIEDLQKMWGQWALRQR